MTVTLIKLTSLEIAQAKYGPKPRPAELKYFIYQYFAAQRRNPNDIMVEQCDGPAKAWAKAQHPRPTHEFLCGWGWRCVIIDMESIHSTGSRTMQVLRSGGVVYDVTAEKLHSVP